jgi:5-methyltetrahydropteroyltriglutamate--homocysteine methyltransferase
MRYLVEACEVARSWPASGWRFDMKRSTDRILVTHQGTLPRAAELKEKVLAKEEGRPYDEAELAAALRNAVRELARKQTEIGIDLVNDGEQSKSGFQYYARLRLAGHEQRDYPGGEGPAFRNTAGRDQRDFPGFFSQRGGAFRRRRSFVTGPIRYIGQDAVRADIDNLKQALQGSRAAEGLLMAVAPGTIEHWMHNEYYRTQEEFLFALADAMHEEYQAITDSGLVLHIDDPDLADGWQIYPEMSLSDYRAYAGLRVEALNRALAGIPPDRVIVHVCWGSFHNPHTNDLALQDIIDLIFKVNAQGVSIEASNVRHAHEWALFERIRLPEGRILIPGVVGHATDLVEHPELIAQRLVRYAKLVGRENVIAGTDCGIGSRVGHAEIAWAKLNALAEGARLASRELWGR